VSGLEWPDLYGIPYLNKIKGEKMRSVNVKFKPSTSEDVVSYRAVITDSKDQTVLFEQNYSIGNLYADGTGYLSFPINGLPELEGFDGLANVSIIAIDDKGNHSPAAILEEVDLDFLAPAPPTDIFIEWL
jgi:hypothetical protein